MNTEQKSIPYLIECLVYGTGSPWISSDILKTSATKYKIPLSGINKDIEEKKVIFYDGLFTVPQIALSENIIGNNIARIMSCKPAYVAESVILRYLNTYERQEKVKLDTCQRSAVIMAVKNNLCVITGGPGTGKTSVIRCISFILRKLFPLQVIEFAAPTGKAAKRITEATGDAAVTLNSELCVGIDKYQPKPVTADTLICDEFSMVDLFLATALMASIQTGKRLIISGDINQLPSVGPGCVLRDLIDSKVIPIVKLEKVFRQDTNSVYYENIRRIKEGKAPLVDGPDFHLVPLNKEHGMVQLLQIYVTMAKKYGVYETGCLIPFRQAGKISTNKFNILTQEKCNSKKAGTISGRQFKVGSPVIQYKNRKEVANGETGKVLDIEPDKITVGFDGIEIVYTRENVDQIDLAFGISIHKSQGSEYPGAIMVIANEHISMCSRNILYTGVTRGKKEFTILYEESALMAAFNKDDNKTRKSVLPLKISYAWEKYSLLRKGVG